MVDLVDGLPFSQACANNRDPILEILLNLFNEHCSVLEIGTGTAQHAVYFASRMPHLHWQPADRASWHDEGRERLQREAPANVAALRELDVCEPSHWEGLCADHVYSANTAHFMPLMAVEQMFERVSALLDDGGLFVLYGPFNENGRFSSDSNAAFDLRLKQRDPSFGIRDINELERFAAAVDMRLGQRHPMPANNQILVFIKD